MQNSRLNLRKSKHHFLVQQKLIILLYLSRILKIGSNIVLIIKLRDRDLGE